MLIADLRFAVKIDYSSRSLIIRLLARQPARSAVGLYRLDGSLVRMKSIAVKKGVNEIVFSFRRNRPGAYIMKCELPNENKKFSKIIEID